MSLNEVLKHTKNLNILYVEDEEISQELYTSIFNDFFLSVDVASDGVEAIEYYLDKSYDIVISDICMPNMDGIELCKTILAKNPNQIIIIMSAHNEEEKLKEIKELGIASILLKPIQNTDLMDILKEVSQIACQRKNN